MKNSYQQKILGYLLSQETKGKNATFKKSIAKMKFRNVSDIHGTVMRSARYIAENGLLKRVDKGEYALTPAGRRTYLLNQ
jgi:hypothetical protein